MHTTYTWKYRFSGALALIIIFGILPINGQTYSIPFSFAQLSPSPVLSFAMDPNGVLLATGNGATGLSTAEQPTSGAELLWYPAKYAFRAGQSSGTNWSDTNIGVGSVAFGSGTVASGGNSSAFGNGAMATGPYSTAFGSMTTALGAISVAFGGGTWASGPGSVAFGGGTSAAGTFSVAFGQQTTAGAVGEVVFGLWNKGVGDGGAAVSNTVAAGTDPIVEVGNGTGWSPSSSDAFVVFRNGDALFGPPAGTPAPPAGTPACTVSAPAFVTTAPGGTGDIPMFTGN